MIKVMFKEQTKEEKVDASNQMQFESTPSGIMCFKSQEIGPITFDCPTRVVVIVEEKKLEKD